VEGDELLSLSFPATTLRLRKRTILTFGYSRFQLVEFNSVYGEILICTQTTNISVYSDTQNSVDLNHGIVPPAAEFNELGSVIAKCGYSCDAFFEFYFHISVVRMNEEV